MPWRLYASIGPRSETADRRSGGQTLPPAGRYASIGPRSETADRHCCPGRPLLAGRASIGPRSETADRASANCKWPGTRLSFNWAAVGNRGSVSASFSRSVVMGCFNWAAVGNRGSADFGFRRRQKGLSLQLGRGRKPRIGSQAAGASAKRIWLQLGRGRKPRIGLLGFSGVDLLIPASIGPRSETADR